MSVSQITAAPSVLALNGVEYRLSPLRDCDYGEFERWVQDRYFDVAKRNLADLPDAQKDSLLRHAYERAAGLTINSPEALNLMVTVDGAAKLMYLSLRREHPAITQEEATKLCTDPAVVRQCMDRVEELNRLNQKLPAGRETPRPDGDKKKMPSGLRRFLSRLASGMAGRRKKSAN
ncbi:MAG: hypothetical protein HZA50_11605 [Planctomycetes bacterium]|nr:hypothetical protein [Planctomycetota bacterium]